MANAEKRITIALMVEDIFEDYTKEIIQNVYSAIPVNGSVRLVVLAGKLNNGADVDENSRTYKTVYNTIFRLSDLCRMDGIIISLGSLNQTGMEAFEKRFARDFRRIPKVFIASDTTEYATVKYDNEAGIREAVDYLVNVNGFTKLCMLGGRADNEDAQERRAIFETCLRENEIAFRESAYASTDMSSDCVAEATKLLDDNPGVEAVFCVNDAVAVGLYAAMKNRGLMPGRDVKVFGFDNTHMSGEMSPPLSSIGAREQTIGQKAVEMLLAQINGEQVASAVVPTRLYGRESFDYEAFDDETMDFLDPSGAFIYKMFDDCFYRYRNEQYDREKVDLKRLFFEFISRMLRATKDRYISMEEFNEITRLVDIFIDNGAMEYTDTQKFMNSIGWLQMKVNSLHKSISTNMMINRLFLRLKDKLIFALSEQKENSSRKTIGDRVVLQQLLVMGTDYLGDGKNRQDEIIRNIGKMGVRNAALYMYDEPVVFDRENGAAYPETIRLRCVLKDGEALLLPADRQNGAIGDMFAREELPPGCRGCLAFPVFCGTKIYGVLACEISGSISDRGEFIADQLGRALFLNDANVKTA